MSGTGYLSELESLRAQLTEVAQELAERDRALQERTVHRDRELHDLREESTLLRAIVGGTAAETGDAFFASLAKHLTATLQMQYAIIGAVRAEAPAKIRTLAVASGSALLDNFEYELGHAPCGTGLTDSFWCYTEGVQRLFPDFPPLAAMKVESHSGVSIRDKHGVVVGLIVVMDTKPIANQERLQAFLTVLVPRVAAELHRHQAEAARREAERRLQLTQFAVDHAADGVLWADTSTQFVYANHEACRSLGYTQEELLTLRIADIAPRHDPERFQYRMDRLKQGGAAIYKSVHRRKDGTEFPIEVSVTYLEHDGTVYSCAMFRDITDRTRYEQERAQALTDLQNIMETVPDILFTLDTDGDLTSWNSRLAAVTGYGPEELLHKPAAAFVPLHEQARTAEAIQQALREGRAELNGHLLTKDGRTIPYYWIGAALRDQTGAIIGITGIGRDVSARQQAEQELTRQRRHLLESQALAHLGSWEWNIESGAVDWSDEQYRIFGHAPRAMAVTYDTFLAALLPDDHDRVLAAINAALLGRAPYDIDCRIVRPTGELRTVHCRGDVTRDDSGHPVKMSGTLLDVTERTMIDEALRASEERWQLAIHGSHDGIWDWQISSGEIFYSSRWKTMRGFADHEVPNRLDKWRSRIHPDDLDRVLQNVDRYLARQTSAFFEEYRVQRKDGSYMWILDRGVALWAKDGTPVRMAGSETDITDRKRTETTLRHRLEFEQLIASLSTHFINLTSEDIDSGITHALQALAEFSSVDRSYVFIFRDQGKTIDNTHEWCADGIEPQIDRLQSIPVETFPWIMARHRRGDIVHLPRIPDLPPEAHAEREEFAQQAIQSLLTLPLLGAHGVIGFLGFDMVREERHWEPEDIALLKLVGEMFANAIERQQAEAALRKSVDRFDLGVRGSRDGLWYAERVSDDLFAPQNPIYYSPRMKEIMGVEGTAMPDVLGTWFTLVHPDDLPTVLAALTQHLEQRLPYDVEYRIYQHGTGTLRWIAAKGQAVWDAVGQPVRMAGSFSDITERKQSEHKLSLTQYTVDHAIDAFYWIDPQAKILDVNEAASLMLGYSKDELLAMSVYDLNPSFQASSWPEFWAESKQRRSMQFETAHRAKQGQLIPVEIQVNHLTFEGKEFHCAYVRDITERKRAELALRESEARTRSILETALDAVVSIDDRGLIIGWNPQAEILFGYSADDVLGHPLDDTIIPARYRHAHTHGMNRLIRGEEGADTKRRFEFFALHRSGREFPVEFAIATAQVEGQSLFTAFIRDITERKQAETALRESEERYRTVIDLSPSGIIVFCEGRPVYANSMAVTILEAEGLDGILECSSLDFIHPNYHEQAVHTIRKVLAGETPVHRAERVYVKMDGTPIHVQVETVRLMWNGKPAVQEFFSDITERKQMEEALQRNERQLRTVLDTLPIGVWFTDEKGHVLYGNPVGQRLWSDATRVGLPQPEGSTLWWETLEKMDSPHRWTIGAVLARGRDQMNEMLEIETTTGDRRTIRNSALPVKNDAGGILGAIVLNEDITARIRAEQALRQEHGLLMAVMDAATDIIFVKDLMGRYIHMNRAGARTIGMAVDEVIGWNDYAIWAPDLAASCQLADRRVLDTGEPITVEEISEDNDNATIYLTTKAPYRDPEGRIVGVIGVARDITERKRAEEALRASEQLFAKAFRASPNPIAITEVATGRCIDTNQACLDLLGFSREETVGQTTLMLSIWPNPQDRDRLITRLQTPGPIRNEEMTFSTKSGDLRHVLVSSDLVEMNGKQCLITVGSDITERMRAEEDLRRSHAFIRQIIDTNPNFIFAKDRDGRFTLVNKAIADAYGTTVDNLLGKTDADFNRNAEEVAFFLRKDREVMDHLHEQFIPEERITDATGTVRWLQTVKRPILDETSQTTMVLGASTDITERKRIEEALRQRERDLRAALDERERISQDLHDGILQSLYAVGLGLEACAPLMTQQQYPKAVATMGKAIGQLNHVMSEVRNFIAGLESQVLQGSTFPSALREMVRMLTAPHPLRYTVTVDEGAASGISTEQALHLLNIVREAISNSLRHAQATKATVRLKSLARSIRLSIVDNGIGFESASMRGVGHGLANMATRARKVGGRFIIKSVPKRGTRITIDLPKETRHAESERECDSTAARRRS